jgi:MoaA/NifB/PqqE/SkfB family radical SAM enzyme
MIKNNVEFGVFFEITDLCNHECVHCCKSWRTDGNHTMNKNMLDIILTYPKDYLIISGGEPALARNEVMYICEHEVKPIALNTNLTLWSENDLMYLNDRLLFKVSVPSMVKSEFEQITGAKTYDKLVNNLNLIKKSSQIIIIVNNYTINTVQQTIDNLALMGFYKFTVQPQMPTDITSIDIEASLKNLERIYLNKRNLNIELLCKSYCESIIPVKHTCVAGIGRFVILSNGDVVPCAGYKAQKLGNILDTDYQELRKRGIEYFNSYEDKLTCRGFQSVRA